jgi:acyl-CoA reductase-like NAD-dependent aldehyde dehydrogenase
VTRPADPAAGPGAAGIVTDKLLIGGAWSGARSGRTWDLVDPGSGEVVQAVPFGDAEDARAAVDAADAAFGAWSRASPYQRAEVLEGAADWVAERVDALARITTLESGKPLAEARAEWVSCQGYLRWFAGEAVRNYGRVVPAKLPSRRITVLHQPVGVVATITAWNFPVYNLVRTWAAALAAGCTVVARPSEFTPRSGMALAQALLESGAPPGVINLVNGEPEAMGQLFLDDVRVRKIAFTGSPRVGKLLLDGASRTLTRLALELGGNAPVLVFPDVDVTAVAEASLRWKVRNAGQACVAPQRFLVHEDVAEAFTGAVVEAARSLRVGHGLDDGVDMGPMITARQRDRVDAMVRGSVERGARLVLGGAPLERPGFYYPPTLLDRVAPGMPVVDEEVFGPVMPISTFRDLGEAIDLANASEHGLTAFVMTNDLRVATLASERLEYGMVGVNDWLPATPEAPFGGVKQSGMGRETGSEGMLEYMEVKTVFSGGLG